jgi:NTP pyrophosphatase (non-canonical NTP hydrolase)
MIDMKTYQQHAAETANDTLASSIRLAVAGLGLAGEAGEVADHIKKYIGHDHALDRDRVSKELGDVLWYVAEICTVLDFDMSEVAGQNLKKLGKRYPNGFDPERSRNR